MTDALVSELRLWAQSAGSPSEIGECLTQAADAIDLLTRERDEAREERDKMSAALRCIHDYGTEPMCINAAAGGLGIKHD